MVHDITLTIGSSLWLIDFASGAGRSDFGAYHQPNPSEHDADKVLPRVTHTDCVRIPDKRAASL